MPSSRHPQGIPHAGIIGLGPIATGNVYQYIPEQHNRFQRKEKKNLKLISIKNLRPRIGETFANKNGQKFFLRRIGKGVKRGTFEIEYHDGKRVICTKKLKARRLPRR